MIGLRDGLGKIKQELADNLSDLGEDDRYGKQMVAFYKRAKQHLEDLEDDVKNAESTFTDAINYYGEDDKNMSSSEFYGIFKTFVTSYKVKDLENFVQTFC
jgi:cytokinesis protein